MPHIEDNDGPVVLDRAGLDGLITALRQQSFTVLGPTVRDGAIVLDEIECVDDLPEGWSDDQEPGRYRLEPRSDTALFAHAVGPRSTRLSLFPPKHRLFRAERDAEHGMTLQVDDEEVPALAVLARPCEVQAIAVQDRVFLEGRNPDPGYAARRAALFVIAVNCGSPSATCFCSSMGSGPRVDMKLPWDLAITELLDGEQRFVVEIGSERGSELVCGLPGRPATADDIAGTDRVTARAERRMGRHLDTAGIHDLLLRNAEHPHWDDVAERCLTCGNCTMVCPTCFCSTVEDVTDLNGGAERWRMWDSCFNTNYSFIHGGSIRASARSRYRQWLTHKLATWTDQFGTSGCVGCGRCITWCPAGIDLTAEVRAIRASDWAGIHVPSYASTRSREG